MIVYTGANLKNMQVNLLYVILMAVRTKILSRYVYVYMPLRNMLPYIYKYSFSSIEAQFFFQAVLIYQTSYLCYYRKSSIISIK